MQDEAKVFSFRASDGNTVKLEYRESLPSAAALAKEYAISGYPDRYAIFTEKQTAVSALDAPLLNGESEKGLFLSCILRPSIFPSQVGVVAPLGAVALMLALEEHTSKKMGIGWVSDIYCEGIKIGGAATEGKLDDFSSYEYLIVSFSVRLDEKNFPPRLTDMVRQVFEDDNVSVPMIMAKTVLNKFFSVYKELKNPEKHLNVYVNKFALSDTKISFVEGGKKKSAKAICINKDDLTLMIETRDGRKINISSPSAVIIPNKI